MTQIEQIKDYIAKEIKKFPHKEGLQETNVVNAIVRNVLKKLESFINYLPDEQPSEDLKKEIDRFQKAKYGGDVISVASIACHFANWQKEQMMKSAIDAIITSRWKDSHVCLTTNKDIPQIYNGDRVKIIIIKEDEQ